jgi:hypothetical protein
LTIAELPALSESYALRHALAHPQPDEFLCEPSSIVD